MQDHHRERISRASTLGRALNPPALTGTPRRPRTASLRVGGHEICPSATDNPLRLWRSQRSRRRPIADPLDLRSVARASCPSRVSRSPQAVTSVKARCTRAGGSLIPHPATAAIATSPSAPRPSNYSSMAAYGRHGGVAGLKQPS